MNNMKIKITTAASKKKRRGELRDRFAAYAITARMSGDIGFVCPDKLEAISRECYRIADAMLKVREEE